MSKFQFCFLGFFAPKKVKLILARTALYSLFILAILICASGSSLAQQIQGEVRYASSGQPIIGALVRCDGTGGVSEQLTDRSGKFYFRVSPGHYTVSTRQPGYSEEQRSVDMMDTQQSEYMFLRLRPAPSTTPALPKATVLDSNVPEAARKEYEAGYILFRQQPTEKKLAETVSHLEKAVSLYPNFFEALLLLGSTYMDQHQFAKAEISLRQAAALNPKEGEPLFALGEIYRFQKRYPDAEKALQEGLLLDSRSWQGHFTLARIYWELAALAKDDANRKAAEGRSYLEVTRALQLNPNMAPAHLLTGNLLMRAHRAKDALPHFEEYLRLDPKGEFASDTKSLLQKIKQALAQTGNK